MMPRGNGAGVSAGGDGFAPGRWYVLVGRVDRAGHSAAVSRSGGETQTLRRARFFASEPEALGFLARLDRRPRRTYRVQEASERDRPRPPRRRDRAVQLTLC